MYPTRRRPDLTDAFAALAMVSAVAYVVGFLVLHTLRPEVDPTSDPASAYATGEHGWLMTAVRLAQALSLLALALALVGAGPPPRLVAVGIGLLLVATLALLLVAAAPRSLTWLPDLTGSGADRAASVWWIALPLAATLIAYGVARVPVWRSHRALCALCTVGIVAAAAVAFLTRSTDVAGAGERVLLGVTALWVLVTASRLRTVRELHRTADGPGHLVTV